VKKVFIDCGFYRGVSIEFFKKTKEYSEDFIFYGFDASIEDISDKSVIFSNNAVWIYDGTIDFYKSERRRGRCNGVFSNQRAKKEKIVSVPCIDFGKWIKNNFNIGDFIVLKMDIEGGEFDVLQSMINDGSINFIDIAYVEFHYKRDPYRHIKQQLLEIKTLELRKKIESCAKRYK